MPTRLLVAQLTKAPWTTMATVTSQACVTKTQATYWTRQPLGRPVPLTAPKSNRHSWEVLAMRSRPASLESEDRAKTIRTKGRGRPCADHLEPTAAMLISATSTSHLWTSSGIWRRRRPRFTCSFRRRLRGGAGSCSLFAPTYFWTCLLGSARRPSTVKLKPAVDLIQLQNASKSWTGPKKCISSSLSVACTLSSKVCLESSSLIKSKRRK